MSQRNRSRGRLATITAALLLVLAPAVLSAQRAELEKKLEDKFGSRVAISQGSQGRGELKIGFESTEDLNRILEILEP